jgi:hypothetical protein
MGQICLADAVTLSIPPRIRLGNKIAMRRDVGAGARHASILLNDRFSHSARAALIHFHIHVALVLLFALISGQAIYLSFDARKILRLRALRKAFFRLLRVPEGERPQTIARAQFPRGASIVFPDVPSDNSSHRIRVKRD